MAGCRSILRAFTNKDYRKQIETLLDEGWSAERTGRNHFQLTHPNAAWPITTSGTPSDYRATENLRAQAKRSLRQGTSTTAMPENPGIIPEISAPLAAAMMGPLRNADLSLPTTRRKKRWDSAQKSARTSAIMAAPVAETPMSKPVTAMPVAVMADQSSVTPQACENGKDAQKLNTQNVIQMPGKPMENEENMTTTASQTAQPVPDLRPEPLIDPVEPAAIPEPVTDALSSLSQLDGGLLAIAMRIVTGDLRQITITADMVGKSLVLGREAWLVANEGPAISPRVPEIRKAVPPSGMYQTAMNLDNDPLSCSIVETLRAFPDNWLCVREIGALIENSTGVSARAHLQNIRLRLSRLNAAGQISHREGISFGRTAAEYRLAA